MLCLLVALAGAAVSARAADADLTRLRAERREAMRARLATADKGAAPASFGLLVIPVDFADARLPEGWAATDLAARLYPDAGESLHNYFRVASGGRLDLRIVTADAVHLAGTRLSYSDIGWNGFTRTRQLATDALSAVVDRGFRLRDVDDDGPDGVPGSGDDDGMVDGVLILHAGIGQENDVDEGVVQALQFFLDEPVISDGVGASFYAVASLHSGPGIWAHETAHLLGLEDRYDPQLGVEGGSEVHSLGGLGRFSLMASGAWGTGGGWGAALPDAYSLMQMGWADVTAVGGFPADGDTLRPLVAGGRAARIWTDGTRGPEFFLLEVRDPAAAAPFDADVPAGGALIYHVDESLPEGAAADDGAGRWHLRVGLVEADADQRLHGGEDAGTAADLFPGSGGVDAFTPSSVPDSDGYGGPSAVRLTGIRTVPGGVAFSASHADAPSFAAELSFVVGAEATARIVVRQTGTPFTAPRLTVALTDPADPWGAFAGGAATVAVDLTETAPGIWEPSTAVAWLPSGDVPSDARSGFRLTVDDGAYSGSTLRTWCWGDDAGVLDFAAAWPGQWIAEVEGTATTGWQYWDAAGIRADGGPVLACTGPAGAGGAAWPDVVYDNDADATLTSGPLGAGVTAVRLVHAVEVEMLDAAIAYDGALVEWLGPDGAVVAAEPLGGWDAAVWPKADQALHGRGGFGGDALELTDGVPLWRVDVVPVPTGAGPGPWRLRLRLAADGLWRRRGWFVADITALTGDPEPGGLTALWTDAGLAWTWPFATAAQGARVDGRADPLAAWAPLAGLGTLPGGGQGTHVVAASAVLSALAGGPSQRHEVRCVALSDWGPLAARAVVIYGDGGAQARQGLSLPWPNPSPAAVHVNVDVAGPAAARLRIFDLRGRCLWERMYAPGSWLVDWNGVDAHGRRLPSGTYFMRLEGSGPAMTRKVVLLH